MAVISEAVSIGTVEIIELDLKLVEW